MASPGPSASFASLTIAREKQHRGKTSAHVRVQKICEKFKCQLNGWTDGWMDGWIDGWMDGWMNG
jgi:hypothetical protein